MRDVALKLAAQALRAMAEALEEPVAQRDVKPDFAADLDQMRDAAARPVAAPAAKPPRKRKRDRSRAKADGGGNPATPLPPHEAAGLVDALAARHGTLEAAATALGVRVSTFGLWRTGRISAGALSRLREAATAPVGQKRRFGGPQRAQEATSAGADEAPAGAGRADDEAA